MWVKLDPRDRKGRADRTEDGKRRPCWSLLLTFPSASVTVQSAPPQKIAMMKCGMPRDQGGQIFFCKGTKDKYFRLCKPHGLLQLFNSATAQCKSSYKEQMDDHCPISIALYKSRWLARSGPWVSLSTSVLESKAWLSRGQENIKILTWSPTIFHTFLHFLKLLYLQQTPTVKLG